MEHTVFVHLNYKGDTLTASITPNGLIISNGKEYDSLKSYLNSITNEKTNIKLYKDLFFGCKDMYNINYDEISSLLAGIIGQQRLQTIYNFVTEKYEQTKRENSTAEESTTSTNSGNNDESIELFIELLSNMNIKCFRNLENYSKKQKKQMAKKLCLIASELLED